MSLAAVEARLKLEPARLFLVTEGSTDKRLISIYCREKCSNVDTYASDDIEIIIAEDLRQYGGNKGRVMTLLLSNSIVPFAGINAAGLVDRDLDAPLQRLVDLPGIIYTEHSCLLSSLLEADIISKWIELTYGRKITRLHLDELRRFAITLYQLRVVVQRDFAGSSLPDIARSVRTSKEGSFDWDRYIKTTAQCIGRGVTAKEIVERMKEVAVDGDMRDFVHFHTVAYYMHAFFRKERIFSSDVSNEEIYRQTYMLFYQHSAGLNTLLRISALAEALLAA